MGEEAKTVHNHHKKLHSHRNVQLGHDLIKLRRNNMCVIAAINAGYHPVPQQCITLQRPNEEQIVDWIEIVLI